MKREKSCGAVIFQPGKQTEYLLLHYPSGHWDFVKGNVEKDETEKETAVREAKEETGLNVKIISGFKEKISYFYRAGELINKEVIFFLAEADSKSVKLSFEHKGFKWLPFEGACGQITYENSKQVLKKADTFLKSVKKKNLKEFV